MRGVVDFLGWQSKTPVPTLIILQGGNGYGSVGTACKRFTALVKTTGRGATYVPDALNGDSIVINEPGIYSITYYDGASADAAAQGGISYNASSLTSAVQALAAEQRLALMILQVANRNTYAVCSGAPMYQGDVIRFQNDTSMNKTSATDVQVVLCKIGTFA